MGRFRTLLSAFLGLVLLVQGFAVSAAPGGKLSGEASASASVTTAMPCQVQKSAKTNDSGNQHPSCCNENCPNMTTCTLGHLASVATVSVALPQEAKAERGFSPVRIASRTLNSPLRPPIALHG